MSGDTGEIKLKYNEPDLRFNKLDALKIVWPSLAKELYSIPTCIYNPLV